MRLSLLALLLVAAPAHAETLRVMSFNIYGGGANDLQNFVDKHLHYLDLLENIKSDLIGVYTDLTTIKNAI